MQIFVLFCFSLVCGNEAEQFSSLIFFLFLFIFIDLYTFTLPPGSLICLLGGKLK